jgi:hypothetical protein
MEELRKEPDEVAGMEVADATVAELREINAGRAKVISKALKKTAARA